MLAAAADFGGLVGRLIRRASQIGTARASDLAARGARANTDWRDPASLWPLFTKGPV